MIKKLLTLKVFVDMASGEVWSFDITNSRTIVVFLGPKQSERPYEKRVEIDGNDLIDKVLRGDMHFADEFNKAVVDCIINYSTFFIEGEEESVLVMRNVEAIYLEFSGPRDFSEPEAKERFGDPRREIPKLKQEYESFVQTFGMEPDLSNIFKFRQNYYYFRCVNEDIFINLMNNDLPAEEPIDDEDLTEAIAYKFGITSYRIQDYSIIFGNNRESLKCIKEGNGRDLKRRDKLSKEWSKIFA